MEQFPWDKDIANIALFISSIKETKSKDKAQDISYYIVALLFYKYYHMNIEMSEISETRSRIIKLFEKIGFMTFSLANTYLPVSSVQNTNFLIIDKITNDFIYRFKIMNSEQIKEEFMPFIKNKRAQILQTKDLEADFSELNLENEMKKILENRFKESRLCIESGAYFAASILISSIIEGLLFSILNRYISQANQSKVVPRNQMNQQPKKLKDWTLRNMIEVAHDIGFIGIDAKKYTNVLIELRNFIHPREHMKHSDFNPDLDSCKMALSVVITITNDLKLIGR